MLLLFGNFGLDFVAATGQSNHYRLEIHLVITNKNTAMWLRRDSGKSQNL